MSRLVRTQRESGDFLLWLSNYPTDWFSFLCRRDRTQEVQSLRLCQGHPNIVNIHEVYQDGVSGIEL